jgi:1-acyl-sn-glycerol-3-phosphate acyltransferase
LLAAGGWAALSGVLSNALSRRLVLTVAAVLSAAAGALALSLELAATTGVLLIVWGWTTLTVALAAAAMSPAAAADARLPLTSLNGVSAAVCAAALAFAALPADIPSVGPRTGPSTLSPLGVLALGMLGAAAALLSTFRGDAPRPERSPRAAIGGFFRDLVRILRDGEARAALMGWALLWAAPLAAAAALIRLPPSAETLNALFLSAVGAAVGFLVGGLNGHPLRSLGWVSLGTTFLVLALGWPVLSGEPPWLLIGLLFGAVAVPLHALYLTALPADARGNGVGLLHGLTLVLAALLLWPLSASIDAGWLTKEGVFAVLAVLAALGAAVAWWALLVPTLELFTEWFLVPMYRIRLVGPGADRLPRRGPLLIVANHSAWSDPFWIGLVTPRHVRPMMTSRFYDLPVIRWLMVHVVRAIRVAHGGFRRETPELDEAAAALRNGECVAIFPEGGMRRSEDKLLHPFGQGVWRILCMQPLTSVVVCWIEGGWGSFTSYFRGPPTKNKRLDWRRPITIAAAEPEILSPDLLADKQRTRDYLWRRCLECRRHLGLDVPEGPPPGGEALQPETEGP